MPERKAMINFDEEIQKFHPALEINDVESAIKKENAAEDLTDLMIKVMNAKEQDKPGSFFDL